MPDELGNSSVNCIIWSYTYKADTGTRGFTAVQDQGNVLSDRAPWESPSVFALNRRTQISLVEWSDGFWLLSVALREIKGGSPSFTSAHSAELSMQAPTHPYGF